MKLILTKEIVERQYEVMLNDESGTRRVYLVTIQHDKDGKFNSYYLRDFYGWDMTASFHLNDQLNALPEFQLAVKNN
jgi:hypothetical protein